MTALLITELLLSGLSKEDVSEMLYFCSYFDQNYWTLTLENVIRMHCLG